MPDRHDWFMYYAIEGKRVLKLLYLLGALLGALIINVGVKSGLFHIYDFLDYTGYISSLDKNNCRDLFSCILLVRIRQLVLFVLCIFLLSPFGAYCLLIFFYALISGSFISLLVIRFGFPGTVYGMMFMTPHIICYGLMFFFIYQYLFGYPVENHYYAAKLLYRNKKAGFMRIMGSKLFTALASMGMFAAGCFLEGYVNPLLLKMFLPFA